MQGRLRLHRAVLTDDMLSSYHSTAVYLGGTGLCTSLSGALLSQAPFAKGIVGESIGDPLDHQTCRPYVSPSVGLKSGTYLLYTNDISDRID
jgi:hypothetical protein